MRLQRRLGLTTLYVTHDQDEAMAMGDRVAVMRDGAIVQCDVPIDVYDHPHDVFVAQFVGTPPMNLVEASVVEPDGGGYALRVGHQERAARRWRRRPATAPSRSRRSRRRPRLPG